MSDRVIAVEAYKDALVHQEASSREAVARFLADDVEVLTNFGRAKGADEALAHSFYGRARIEAGAEARARIFDGSNVREQQMDFRRRGVAIVVDLDRIEGRGPAGRVLMVRT